MTVMAGVVLPRVGPDPAVDVYLWIRPLPSRCFPARIVREDGMTLLMVDPTCTRMQVTQYSLDHLTPAELAAYRDAFGQPPPGEALDDWMVDDGPCFLYVPPVLRLRRHRAIQGGPDERERRRSEGLLEQELIAWRAELQAHNSKRTAKWLV